MSVNTNYPDTVIVDLTKDEDHPEIYIQKDYRNYTLKDDGVIFVEAKRLCPGCYPIFQPNQLAHMDPGGCLCQDYTVDDALSNPPKVD